MEVAEDRKWAVDLTDEEFAKKYGDEHPFQDIPTRKGYISWKPRKGALIDPPSFADAIITKSDERKAEVKEVREIKAKAEQVFCQGCGKVFTGKGNSKYAHKGTHEKKCKVLLSMRQ